MIHVTALGELLIDFFPAGTSGTGNTLYEASPGGAPCNVLSQLARLGKTTAFIGKVGSDHFGLSLGALLEHLGIGVQGLRYSTDAFTTLAFVHLNEDGDRSFSFSRHNSADVMLSPNEVDLTIIEQSRIFHIGSLSMTSDPSRSATIKALQHAKGKGVAISVDPNLREPLWPDLDLARREMFHVLQYADIIKISDYELQFLYGSADLQATADQLCAEVQPSILFITCGKDGAYIKTKKGFWRHKCFTEVNTIDTTGAGDAFLGAALSIILETGLSPNEEQAMHILRFASAAAALVTTRKGAIRSMPSLGEIEHLAQNKER